MAGLETDVLIVGAGPVGTTCAILAAAMGVRTLLIEKRAGVSAQPKARALTVRSLEIFRQIGLADAVHRTMPPGRNRFYAIAPSIASDRLRRVPFGLGTFDARQDTPEIGSFCPQDYLEPILAERLAREPLAELRRETELVAFEQTASGITAIAQGRTEPIEIRAMALVGSDGANGPVAGLAGIQAPESQGLDPAVSVLFRAPLSHLIDPLDSVYLLLGDPATPDCGMMSGAALARDGEEWSMVMTRLPGWEAQLTPETEPLWRDAVRRVLGLPDLAVEITGVSQWRRAASTAQRFAAGRVALAGDAAHLMPPAGGLGLNTGLQDAHNLAWRLAALVYGGSPTLFEDYDGERRPEAARSVDAAVRNYRQGADIDAIWNTPQVGLSLGVDYSVGGGDRAYPYHDYAPSARPGRRAPHFWLDESHQHSVLGLFGREWAVLSAGVWPGEAVGRLRAAGAPVMHHILPGPWRKLYGLEEEGAVLVRPDGIVAWRTEPGAMDLESAFWQVTHNPARRWGRKP